MAWSDEEILARSYSQLFVGVVSVVVFGFDSPEVEWELRHDDDRNAAGTLLASGTATSTTTGDETAIGAYITAGDFIWVEVTESSGSVVAVEFSLQCREYRGVMQYNVARLIQIPIPTTSGAPTLPLLLN